MFTFKHFFLLNFHCLTYSALKVKLKYTGQKLRKVQSSVKIGDFDRIKNKQTIKHALMFLHPLHNLEKSVVSE